MHSRDMTAPSARHQFRPLAALLLVAACAGELEQSPEDRGPGYETLMARARIPGMTVAVIEGGRIVESQLLGVANAETAEALTAATLFEAASLSKPVFATAVLRLAERGELDLDRPLHELLPYERIAHDPRSAALTARIVLSHQTGLPNWGPERLEFEFDPGERFGYSGEGYVYLQRVVEATTGLTLDELARREVFEPLGMTHSRFSWPEGEAPELATPHDQAGRPQPKQQVHEGNAAASLHTTAEDFARFVAAWIDGTVLRPETLAAALAPVVRMRGEERDGDKPREVWERIGWGLGWGLQLPRAEPAAPDDGEPIAVEPIVWHWGDNGPFKAFVAFRPESRSGVVYFANSQNGLAVGRALVAGVVGDMDATFEWAGYERHDAPGFAERLDGFAAETDGAYEKAIEHFRAALAADPSDEQTAQRVEWLQDFLRIEETPVVVPEEILQRYAGSYGPRTLTLEEGTLHYQRQGRPLYRLLALSPTLFAVDGIVDFRLEVVLDEAAAPFKLVGHYLGGGTDESPRDP